MGDWALRVIRPFRGMQGAVAPCGVGKFYTGLMARQEHLPIYKAALDAAVHFEQVVEGFSRHHKYSRLLKNTDLFSLTRSGG